MILSGHVHREVLELHKRYGPVIRIGPNTLAYSHPDAMRQIRSFRPKDKPEHIKDPNLQVFNKQNIVGADRVNHTRYRKIMRRAFSHNAVLEQQPIILRYTDRLCSRLRDISGDGKGAIDIARWFSYVMIDIIGDLTFGEPFECLEEPLRSSMNHPIVDMVFHTFKSRAFSSAFRRCRYVSSILESLWMPNETSSQYNDHRELTAQKLQRRLALGSNRPDYITAMTTIKNPNEVNIYWLEKWRMMV